MSIGSVSSELHVPVNRHLYIRPASVQYDVTMRKINVN